MPFNIERCSFVFFFRLFSMYVDWLDACMDMCAREGKSERERMTVYMLYENENNSIIQFHTLFNAIASCTI